VGPRLQLEIEPQEAFTAYSQQLTEADWELVSQETAETSVTSLWSFTDDEGALWRRIFTLFPANPTDGEYLAFLMVEKVQSE